MSRVSVGGFHDLESAAAVTTLRDGSTVLVMSYEDLVRSKRDAGRDRDLLDIEALREVRGES